MKIALDCRLLQTAVLTDGAGRYAFNLLTALLEQARTLELHFFGYQDAAETQLSRLLQKGGHFTSVFRRTSSTALNYLCTQMMYPRILAQKRIDLYHGLFQTDALCCSSIAQVLTVHDLGPYYSYPDPLRRKIQAMTGISIKPKLSHTLRFRMMRKARMIVADSAFTREQVLRLKLAAAEHVSIVYPGLHHIQPVVDEPTRPNMLRTLGVVAPYILMVGRVQPYKNIIGAINAFHLLVARNLFEGTLVIVGHTSDESERRYLRTCQDVAKHLGIAEKVRFLPYVSDQNLGALYAGAAVLLQASFLEGFGFPPLEAAQVGIPVVIADIGSLPEILPRAIKVSPFDAETIAAGLVAALHQHRIEPMAWRSWAQTAQEMAAIYQNIYATRTMA